LKPAFPKVKLKVPAGVAVAAPLGQTYPASQLPDTPVAPSKQYFPGSHGVHCEDADSLVFALYVPAGHLILLIVPEVPVGQ